MGQLGRWSKWVTSCVFGSSTIQYSWQFSCSELPQLNCYRFVSEKRSHGQGRAGSSHNWACLLTQSCHFLAVLGIAAVIAATAFVGASANPLAWLVQRPLTDNGNEVRPDLRRGLVDYRGRQAAGSIIIDTLNTHLYFVLSGTKAIRYGIGVGREGFTWSGVRTIERKAMWPDWTPPPEMIARSPYLPRFMAGGEGNPLGARALYLSGSMYRIHGTNAPSTIGSRATSGCIRMVNEDVIDLYDRVTIGAKVMVLPMPVHPLTGQLMGW